MNKITITIEKHHLDSLYQACRFHRKTSDELNVLDEGSRYSFEAGLRSLAAEAMHLNKEICISQGKDWVPCNKGDSGKLVDEEDLEEEL